VNKKRKNNKDKNRASWWFYLERYVHVNVKSNDVLLYNTLNGKHLVYKNRPRLAKFVQGLLKRNSSHVIRLTHTDLQRKPELRHFINLTHRDLMADLIDTRFSQERPIQLPREVHIHRDIKRLAADTDRSVGEDVMKNLDRITLYIDTTVNPALVNQCPGLFENAYRQFPTNMHSVSSPGNLAWDKIMQLFRETSGGRLTCIDIAGGNIFAFPEFSQLLGLLSQIPAVKRFLVPAMDILSNIEFIEHIRADVFHSQLIILVPFPMPSLELKRYLDAVQKINIPYMIEFIIQDEQQLETAFQFRERTGFPNISIRPYFNGKNLTFFKANIFLKQKSIFGPKPGIDEINMRRVVNPLAFGKLTILSDGNVYTNINQPAIGQLGKESVYSMISREMATGKGWRQLRSQLKPCRSCLFQFLCPPVSGYEYAVGRYDLCHIKKTIVTADS